MLHANYNTEKTSDSSISILDSGEKFVTRSKSNNNLKKYKVNASGEPELDSSSVLSGNPNQVHLGNKALCKVVSVKEAESCVVIRMTLPKGEILREMDFALLKRLNFAEEGKEFYFSTINKPTGLELVLQPYIQEYDPYMEDVLNELEQFVE